MYVCMHVRIYVYVCTACMYVYMYVCTRFESILLHSGGDKKLQFIDVTERMQGIQGIGNRHKQTEIH